MAEKKEKIKSNLNLDYTGFPEKDCFGNEIIRFNGKQKLQGAIVQGKKLTLKDGELIVVETDKVDTDKLIASEACNAGLENIRKQAALRYGTLNNAIAINADKQNYADVSNIPTNAMQQAQYVEAQRTKLEQLAAKLGVSTDELLSMTEAGFNSFMQSKQQPSATEGSAEGEK